MKFPYPHGFAKLKNNLLIIFCGLFFLTAHNFTSTTYAATVSITNVPSNITSEQEFTATVNIGGASASSNNYIRAAFFTDSSPTSYFGNTYNHLNSWYNGSPSPIDPHQYLQISIGSDGTWSGDVRIKNDSSNTNFTGSGNYNFKIGRYTASATSVSDWSSSVVISIAAPSPTATPTSTPTNTPTPTTAPTPTKTPTPTPTTKPSATATPTLTPKPTEKQTIVNNNIVLPTEDPGLHFPAASDEASIEAQKDVLGSASKPGDSSKQDSNKKSSLEASPNYSAIIFISIGSVLIVSCAILFFLNFKIQKI